MGDFFKGWRRKAGLVTLAMACLLATAWMRSLVTEDTLLVPLNQSLHSLTMHKGVLIWWKRDATPFDPTGWYSSKPLEYSKEMIWHPWMFGNDQWNIPIHLLAVVLTPLSAWLILGKPRTANGGG